MVGATEWESRARGKGCADSVPVMCPQEGAQLLENKALTPQSVLSHAAAAKASGAHLRRWSLLCARTRLFYRKVRGFSPYRGLQGWTRFRLGSMVPPIGETVVQKPDNHVPRGEPRGADAAGTFHNFRLLFYLRPVEPQERRRCRVGRQGVKKGQTGSHRRRGVFLGTGNHCVRRTAVQGPWSAAASAAQSSRSMVPLALSSNRHRQAADQEGLADGAAKHSW